MSDIFAQLYGENVDEKSEDSEPGYLKPTDVKFASDEDNSRTFASYISSKKIGRNAGVVIPHATSGGRSPAFDPEMKQKVFIDPEMTKGQLQVDLGKISAEDFGRCVAEAAKVTTEVEDRAVLAYAMMAKLLSEAEKKKPATATTQKRKTRVIQPQANESPVSISKSFDQTDEDVMTGKQTVKTRRVLFELPKPIGMLHAIYHDVVRTDDLLILVYDHNASVSQNVWFPQPYETSDDEEPSVIHAIVYDDAGNPDTMFEVIPTPGRFTYKNVEFCILAISREKACKPQE